MKLKQFIENVGVDRQITPELRVQDEVVYLQDNFKYEQGNWYQNCDGVWVNLQGGVPEYDQEIMLDELLFEAEDIVDIEEI